MFSCGNSFKQVSFQRDAAAVGNSKSMTISMVTCFS